ncbi:unnamed protein product [Pelagomonas calceolata]|uniref:Ubiquinone biosynthesis protein COQ4 homolog, mitochondrial n=1 Tax=Pelagomonas calceolata TaxID=35677 RepID=A0A8J2X5E2_9STRA|nr:unnamed protein product [Pelagomonas calceolata]|mmetsp:Transcript_19132/g.59048  ORF Transcript_19132/g.59048 Transcript_19132/m.59048 type:complete len:263 (+) Transcript_19132:1916-2704(+)
MRQARRAVAALTRRQPARPLFTDRKSLYRGHLPTNPLQKLAATAISAAKALKDPRRADMVGVLGEATGRVALEKIRSDLKTTREGRLILSERPVVDSTTINGDELRQLDENTFGHAYGRFLERYGFDPDDRTPVALVDDEELAYVLLRYRQVHDFWHVLFGLPPTVHGELVLKWFELVHTGLPVAAFSALFGPLRLSSKQRRRLYDAHVPWATRQGRACTQSLLAVYYEKCFDEDMDLLRKRLGVTVAPPLGTSSPKSASSA